MDSKADLLKCRKPNLKPVIDIPLDISTIIYNQLNFKSKFQFSSVCKHWNTLHKHLNTHPLLMNYESFKLACTFTGRPLDKSYVLRNRQLRIRLGFQFFDANIIAAKRGWLLMNNRINQNHFFCFNPFISEVINLPCLDAGSNCKAAFSAPPSCSDAVIFVARCQDNGIVISLYSSGQIAWKDYSFDISNNLITSCQDVVYTEGKLYCIFDNGVVGFFSLENHNWTMNTSPSSLSTKFLAEEYHMAGCEGEIYMVCMNGSHLHFDFFRLDGKRLEWMKVKSIGNRAMFLNYGSSSISIYTREFKNKLFYFGKEARISCIWCFNLESAAHEQFQSLDGKHFNSQNQVWIDPPN